MAKDKNINSVLILGAGPIVIGQACEFDYSGVQACKALKEEGCRVILINSNPATIMTDPEFADATYIEPIKWQIVEKIIQKEKPDAILPTMGGQTALNCALDLNRHGVLDKYNVKMIGADATAIDKAEDRELFDKAMKDIGLATPNSFIASSLDQAKEKLESIVFPCIIRPSFTMGGTGGGIAYNIEEFEDICNRGLELSPTKELLIDESLIGWKEYEMEVVRDKNDNCIIVCTIENLDPMGIHTGDSITVAPSQTLTDKEFQIMRDAAIAVLRVIGVETGGSNVQFGICPKTGRMVVIEMNPRVSRSSALASKATGFPIAKVAAKLALGFTLDELKNEITGGKTPSSFEPSIDYVVTKIPRFNFEKFKGTSDRLTTQMKSVGEVMAIGRTFKESLQKALSSLEIGTCGFDEQIKLDQENSKTKILQELQTPGAMRIFYLADAYRAKLTDKEISSATNIDFWFLAQIKELIEFESKIEKAGITALDRNTLYSLKQDGFSDKRIAKLVNSSQQEIRKLRNKLDIKPVYKRVDTCAGEFESKTAYMYSTYETNCEANPSTNASKIIVLGGGPNRIGQGIEFDYCCTHAAFSIKEMGAESIMINCNPETVSTDFDTSDRLYFEPITLENVLNIIEIENPQGVIVQFGGQTPLKLAKALEEAGAPIIGTSPDSIDRAEDRERFLQTVSRLNLTQPKNATAFNINQAQNLAKEIGYPLMVRPSYVLGGRAMEIVYDELDLKRYFLESVADNNTSPVLLDAFLMDATEVDVDAICDGQDVVIGAILEHIEEAGVHSGDSACSIPPFSIKKNLQEEIKKQVKMLALELNVIGLLNIQFAIKNDKIYIIEVNPRAARTVPFVSKATGTELAKIATKVMQGKSLKELNVDETTFEVKNFFAVKDVVLPFNKFFGVDPILGPEMRSTGEVMGVGNTFAKAYNKAQLGASKNPPTKTKRALLSVKNSDKVRIKSLAKSLIELGYELDATHGTAVVLGENGINPRLVNKVHEGRPHILDRIKNGEYSYIINTTSGRQAIIDSVELRRAALTNKVIYTTTLNGAFATCVAKSKGLTDDVISLQELHK